MKCNSDRPIKLVSSEIYNFIDEISLLNFVNKRDEKIFDDYEFEAIIFRPIKKCQFVGMVLINIYEII